MHVAVAAGELATIDRLVPELMYNAVLPYLGSEAALEELSIRPPPQPDDGVSRRVSTVPSE